MRWANRPLECGKMFRSKGESEGAVLSQRDGPGFLTTQPRPLLSTVGAPGHQHWPTLFWVVYLPACMAHIISRRMAR